MTKQHHKRPRSKTDKAIQEGIQAEVRRYNREFVVWLQDTVDDTTQTEAMIAVVETAFQWWIESFGEDDGFKLLRKTYRKIAATKKPTLQ